MTRSGASSSSSHGSPIGSGVRTCSAARPGPNVFSRPQGGSLACSIGSRAPTTPEVRRWAMWKGKVAGLAHVGRAGVPREAPRAGDAASSQIRQHHRYSDGEHEPKRHAEEAVESPPRGRVREGGGLPRESTHGQTCDHDGSRDTDEDVGQQDQAGSDGIPWVSLISRRGHALSIGSSAAVLAQWLGSTREVTPITIDTRGRVLAP
jgi:hypothetical protein